MRDIITHDNVAGIRPLAQVKCGWITQVRWGPDGTTLAVAGATGARLYAGTFGANPAQVLAGHGGHVKGAAFSPPYRTADGSYRLLAATCAADATIKLWEITQAREHVREIGVLNGHRDSIDAIAFSPDREHPTLISASADGTLKLWDVDAQTERGTLIGHGGEVTSAVFALNGNVIVSGSWDKTLRLWDAQGETEGTLLGQHDDWVREVRANPHGTMIASASKDGTVALWDAYGEENQAYGRIAAHAGGADCAAFSPDGSLLATGGRDNVIRVWHVESCLRRHTLTRADALLTLTGHERPVMSLDFNRAGTLLASGSGDNTVKLWAVQPEIPLSGDDTPPSLHGTVTARLRDDSDTGG